MRTLDNKKLTREAPLALVAGIALLFIAALLRFALLPQIDRLILNRRELTRYRTLISSENNYREIKQEITNKIKLLRNRLAPLPKQKKDSGDLSGYLETLIDVARKHNIRFGRIQPQDEMHTADFDFYPVLLVLTTSYHELCRFITALEKLPTLFSVDRLAMDAASEGKCDIKLLVTCIIPAEPK
ncbi:MAG: type 4a pilus biogenesis protein PilO [Chitinispirillaceae bacterium]|nr:type 4a pilus biogenesis protein PilO [Chitinispirillaceae bacterium]